MKKLSYIFLSALFLSGTFTLPAQNKSLVNTSQSPYAKLSGVGMSDVHWTNGFWADRFEVCKQSMSPGLMKTYMDESISHSFKNFEIAARIDTGSHVGPPFHDGDFYKAFESLVSLYATTGDKNLMVLMDEIIPVITKSQREDGYIHTPVMIEERKNGQKAKAFDDRLNFETYNMGHLMTMACLHYRVTGKRTLLDVAVKATDYLYNFYKTASPELARNAICPSHYMGVVEMYRTTRDPKYLELSKSLIDIRGLMEDGTDDNQDRVPFRQQTKAMGHAVRANYLYAGVADVYAETGDTSLIRPLNLIWDNMVNTKMYITGACGALYDGVSPNGTSYDPLEVQKTHQSYGRDYQLPNMTAHNETCANIGNLLWNWRMLQLTGEAKYADIVELTLYNSILSGVSLNGLDFCYTNPLAVSDKFPYTMRWSGGRIPYIALSNCCPPNTVRTISEVQNYVYNLSEDGLYVNLYGGSQLKTNLKNGDNIQVTQATDYPWDGQISLTIDKAPKKSFTLSMRIPGWCKGATISVNGKKQEVNLESGSYAQITRTWKNGDKVELNLPMEAKLIETNPLVEETRNQIAVKKGPVVYCLESNDLPKLDIFQVVILSDTKFTPITMNIDNSKFMALEGQAYIENSNWDNTLYREVSPVNKLSSVKLIPYYAWGNRGKSDMTVWMNLKR
ncbi:glycoside hydrolase family 127 protein [Dysgonomonas sp. HGC4]|uniref:aceric acid hydrolase n=1 Tax=Dysgonomonas sp. HGC4 TaxID=1658009 RepID=UPI000680BD61|nr:glycoside hydrolase family 127 protein [Dysgonomonas sp. HGC4]MBD8348482.1 glycoside hydrolase family 127 protein [Dysgonomonas sp. HGC4]